MGRRRWKKRKKKHIWEIQLEYKSHTAHFMFREVLLVLGHFRKERGTNI